MTIVEQLTADLKEAMRSGDVQRRDTVRSLITMIKNEAIAQKIDSIQMDNATVQAIMKRAKKQRDDAAAQYRDGGRPELAAQEIAEAEIIAQYLPEQMSATEVAQIVDEIVATVGTEKANFGIIMGRVMAQAQGRADGALVKRLVDERLS